MTYIDMFRQCVQSFGSNCFTIEQLKEKVLATRKWTDRNEKRFYNYVYKQTLQNGWHNGNVCLEKINDNLYKGI